jgi:hypothetical protein
MWWAWILTNPWMIIVYLPMLWVWWGLLMVAGAIVLVLLVVLGAFWLIGKGLSRLGGLLVRAGKPKPKPRVIAGGRVYSGPTIIQNGGQTWVWKGNGWALI